MRSPTSSHPTARFMHLVRSLNRRADTFTHLSKQSSKRGVRINRHVVPCAAAILPLLFAYGFCTHFLFHTYEPRHTQCKTQFVTRRRHQQNRPKGQINTHRERAVSSKEIKTYSMAIARAIAIKPGYSTFCRHRACSMLIPPALWP